MERNLTLDARRILVSVRLFELPPPLLSALRTHQRARGSDDITAVYDAFLLDPGLGPATYLTSDGRIVWDDDIWGVLGTRADALMAIAVGALKTGLDSLRDLLPIRPADATDCDNCSASGRFDAHGQLRDTHGRSISIVCGQCGGLGWRSPTLVVEASVLPAG